MEYPDGRSTLCLLPAKFHKKLWIKKGNFLYVEAAEVGGPARGGRGPILGPCGVFSCQPLPSPPPARCADCQPSERIAAGRRTRATAA